MGKGFKRTICQSHKEQFKMLLEKCFDLLINPELVGTNVAKKLGVFNQVKMLEFGVTEEPLYIGLFKAKVKQA